MFSLHLGLVLASPALYDPCLFSPISTFYLMTLNRPVYYNATLVHTNLIYATDPTFPDFVIMHYV